MQSGVTPPVQAGVHLTTRDGQFVIAVSLVNRTDEPVSLTTMSSQLFSVSLKDHHGTLLWQHSEVTLAAVTHWTLAADSRITQHFPVPDESTAQNRIDERLARRADRREDIPDADAAREAVTVNISPLNVDPRTPPDPEDPDDEPPVIYETAVEPADVDIVQVVAGLPSTNDLSQTVTRQFDLRHAETATVLDADLPDETLDAIERQG